MENFKYYTIVCVALKVYSVHKYVIFKNKYPKSVQICHLFFISVCKTGHLTPLWTENVFKYKIELILCTWHGNFKYYTIVFVALKVYIVHKYVIFKNKYPKVYKYVIYFL